MLRLLGLWGPVAGWMALIFGFSSLRMPPAGGSVPDWISHGAVYAALAALICRALAGGVRAAPLRVAAMAAALAGAYGVTDEWHQSYVPQRVAEAADVMKNLGGAVLGAALFHRLAPRRPCPRAARHERRRPAHRGGPRRRHRRGRHRRVGEGAGGGGRFGRPAGAPAGVRLGLETYLRTGVSLPEGALAMLQEGFDAILFGAVGDPRVPDNKHAADILLGMRFGLDLVREPPSHQAAATRSCVRLKGASLADVDFVVFRENTEYLYVMMGGNFKKGTPDEVATEVDLNTRKGVERIVRHAFEYARTHARTKVRNGQAQRHPLSREDRNRPVVTTRYPNERTWFLGDGLPVAGAGSVEVRLCIGVARSSYQQQARDKRHAILDTIAPTEGPAYDRIHRPDQGGVCRLPFKRPRRSDPHA